MLIVLIVVFCILLFVLGFKLIKNHFVLKQVLFSFKHCNTITFGKKGSGKDLLTQYVIKKRKKDYYYSNISYGYKYKKITLNDINIAPNTFDNFINNNVVKTKKKLKENCDIYLSDCGIYLPSQYDTLLYKKYPSFPIYYALSRHLYNSNVHCNTQNLGRIWKALREQADFYIRVKRTYKIFGLLITTFVTYDRFDSANKSLEPLSPRTLNKFSKAEYDLYCANNGEIHKGFIIQSCLNVHYDTRVFHKLVFGKKAR